MSSLLIHEQTGCNLFHPKHHNPKSCIKYIAAFYSSYFSCMLSYTNGNFVLCRINLFFIEDLFVYFLRLIVTNSKLKLIKHVSILVAILCLRNLHIKQAIENIVNHSCLLFWKLKLFNVFIQTRRHFNAAPIW